MDNTKRSGFFTSSQMSRCAASLKSGKPSQAYFGYIDEVADERAMGRVVDTEVNTQALKWGRLMEIILFNLLGMEYEMAHKKTILHHRYPTFWSGTPDLIATEKIGEIKCYYPKKFSRLARCLKKKSVEEFKENFKEEYWQCISNAILCKVDKAEIIGYMPYKSELVEIIELITNSDFLEDNGLNPNDYYFMTTQSIETLPYLPDDSKMSNINQFEFEIPKEDILFLTQRVVSSDVAVKEILEE